MQCINIAEAENTLFPICVLFYFFFSPTGAGMLKWQMCRPKAMKFIALILMAERKPTLTLKNLGSKINKEF